MDNHLMKERMMSFANVVMRVPPLFIIDELLRISLGIPENPIVLNDTQSNLKINSVQNSIVESLSAVSPEPFFIQQFNINSYFYQIYVLSIFKFLTCCFGKFKMKKIQSISIIKHNIFYRNNGITIYIYALDKTPRRCLPLPHLSWYNIFVILVKRQHNESNNDLCKFI